MKYIIGVCVIFISTVYSFSQGIYVNNAFVKSSNAYVKCASLKLIETSDYNISGGTLRVENLLSVTGSSVLNLNGELNLNGDLQNNNQLNVLEKGIVTGRGTINSTLTAVLEHQGNGPLYFSVPVSGELSQALEGAFVYEYDETISNWKSITESNRELLAMEGLSIDVRAPKSFEFKGTPFASEIIRNLGNNGGGWNFVGNPFLAPIHWDSVGKSDRINISDAIYYWNAKNKNYTTYLGNPTETGGVQVNEDINSPGVIPKMQGFFVKVIGDADAASLTLNKSAIVSETKNIGGNTARKDVNYLSLVARKDGQILDETVIRFIEDASEMYDPFYDAYKLSSFNENSIDIYTLTNDNEHMVINSFSEQEQDPISLAFRTEKAGNYTIGINEEIKPRFRDIFLIDLLEDERVNLKSKDYEFYHKPGNPTNRFKIHILDLVTGIDSQVSNKSLWIKPIVGGLLINSGQETGQLQLEILNLEGKVILNHNFQLQKNSREVFYPNLSSGIYLVTGQLNSVTVKSKMIIK